VKILALSTDAHVLGLLKSGGPGSCLLRSLDKAVLITLLCRFMTVFIK
jgi:hypothetical protein